MVTTKEKESVKKLVKFIVTFTLAYLVLLQIASLVYLFSIKEKNVSQEVSKEDTPIPAFTMCVRTEHLAREEVLDKYDLRDLLLDQNPDDIFSEDNGIVVGFSWKNFDWGSVSLKQLYDEAVIYPHELMKLCQIGDDYDCTQNDGIYHRWENVLKRGYSCSTLRVWKKAPYSEITGVKMQYEGFPNIPVFNQVHDTSRTVPRYINKYLHDEFRNGTPTEVDTKMAYTYTVEKVKHLHENEGQSCSEDPTTDRLKCEEDCFEKQLLQDNSSCVLPWVMSPGRQCSSLEEAVAMVKKEKELQLIQCDCQDSCTNVRFIHTKTAMFIVTDYAYTAFIDNRLGLTVIEEYYMYTFLGLLANCGGSVGVFFSVSLLWLLETIIITIFSLQYSSSNIKGYLLEYTLKASLLACVSLFLYEASQLISKYQQNPKLLTTQRLDPLQSPLPNFVLCSMESRFNTESFTFTGYYSVSMFSDPINHMIECHLDTESCMEDGSLFSWETLYSTVQVCSVLRFNAAAQYKQLEIIFDDDFDFFTFSLTSMKTPPRYDLFADEISSKISKFSIISGGYSLQHKLNLPPCNDDYFQCQERCWEQEYLKEDLCSPPEMPPTVKYQPCKTVTELIDLIDYYLNLDFISSCGCLQQCSDMIIELSVSQDYYAYDKAKLVITLIPYAFTRTTEEWAFPFTRLLAEFGGMLGLITGMSFLSVLLNSSLKILAWQSKRIAENSLAKHVSNMVITLICFTWLLQQVCTNISYYIESKVHLDKEIATESSFTVLPDFILCHSDLRIRSMEGEIVVTSPGIWIPLANNTLEYIDFNESWFDREKVLTTCTIFGLPCNQEKGEIHEWHDVRNTNRFCHRLEIKPLKLQDYRDNRVVFTAAYTMLVYTANKEEHVLVPVIGVDYAMHTNLGTETHYSVHRSQYELLEEKPNNCINRFSYNRRNCLDQCILDHVLKKFKCRFPWMTYQLSLPICLDHSAYNFFLSINSNFFASCRCPPQCQYTLHNVNYENSLLLPNRQDGSVKITVTVKESKEVFREKWSYPGAKCLADLGGLLSLFTGVTLYNVFLSSDSIFLNLLQQVGMILKFLGISRARI